MTLVNVVQGQTVHYVTGTNKELAAMIVKVWSVSNLDEPDYAVVNLCVFNPYDGEHGEDVSWVKTSITYDPEKGENTWHWIGQ